MEPRDEAVQAVDPRLAAIPDSHGHAKGEHKPYAEERPIPYTARMLFLWFFHACRRGSPRFMMVADHMNYLTFEDPAAVNLVRRALKLAQAGDLFGAAETAGVEVGHAEVVSKGLRRGMRYSIGAEVDNDPRSRPDAQNIVDAMKPDGMIRSVHFLPITHPTHGENWMWAFDNPEFKELYETVGTATVWEIYMATLLEAIEKLPGHIVGHFYVPAVFGHWPDDATLEGYEDRFIEACAQRGVAIEINSRYVYKHYVGDDAQLEKFRAAHVRLLRKAKEKNVEIAVGSDAHSPKDQGRAFDAVLAILDEVEINEIAFPIGGRLARVALRATEEIMKQYAPPEPEPVPAPAAAAAQSEDDADTASETIAAEPAAPPKAKKPRPSRSKAALAAAAEAAAAGAAAAGLSDESAAPAGDRAEPAAPLETRADEHAPEIAAEAPPAAQTPLAESSPVEVPGAQTPAHAAASTGAAAPAAASDAAAEPETAAAPEAKRKPVPRKKAATSSPEPAKPSALEQLADAAKGVIAAVVQSISPGPKPQEPAGIMDALPAATKPAAPAKPAERSAPKAAQKAPTPKAASAKPVAASAKPAAAPAKKKASTAKTVRPTPKTAAKKSAPAKKVAVKKSTAKPATKKKAASAKPAVKKTAPKPTAKKNKIAKKAAPKKKATSKTASSKKAPAKNAAAKKATAKKAPAKKNPPKTVKRSAAKRAPVKKSPAKKPARRR